MQFAELLMWVVLYMGFALAIALVLGRVLRTRRTEDSRPADPHRPRAVMHDLTTGEIVPVADTEGGKLYNAIFREDREPLCPTCLNEGMYGGPEGGMSQNIHCMNVACRAAFNITPVIEIAERIGRRGFDWYPDGPPKDAAALAMLKDAWLDSMTPHKVYSKFNRDHVRHEAINIPEGYGWGVVSYKDDGEPVSVTGPFPDKAAALAAIGGTPAFRYPPEPHRDPDNLTATEAARRARRDDDDSSFLAGVAVGHVLTDTDAQGHRTVTPGGGSFGGGGATGAWEADKAEADRIVRSGAAIGVSAAVAAAYVPPDLEEVQAKGADLYAEAARAVEASVSADASPSYSSPSDSYSSSSDSGGDSGGGGGGGGE